jgi:hypothetical protein
MAGGDMLYGTFLGSPTGIDSGGSVALDAGGNAYLTGQTNVPNFPTTPGAFDRTFNGGYDPFIAKFDPTGSALLYSTYLGGAEYDFTNDLAVDSVGSAYVTGDTSSSNFPVTPGAFDTTPSPSGDAFVTKLNPTGSALAYSTFLGGNDDEAGRGIVVDESGSAHVTGHTYSDNFPVTPDAYDPTFNGLYDAFVTRLNDAGSALLYSTFLGADSGEAGTGVALDSVGNAYVTGETFSRLFPTTPGAFDRTLNDYVDIFLIKLALGEGCVTACLRSTAIDLYARQITPGLFAVAGIVTVEDETGSPAPGALVSATWTFPNGGTQSRAALTNAQGRALFLTFNSGGTYTLTINNITRAGYTFDPANSVLEESITTP